jgi:hypothetical protein
VAAPVGARYNMGQRFADIAFTPTVRTVEETMGRRAAYAACQRATQSGDPLPGPGSL